jgi:nicotinamidase-related amidase
MLNRLKNMTSLPIRDPKEDHLLTPENSVLILIDYQPPQIFTTKSMDKQQLINNVVALTKIAKNFGLPIILTTVNVSNGVNADTIPQLRSVIPDVRSIDRTTINSWEDEEFLKAVKATGRKKLIMAALWTEACLIFPALDALKEGYEVYPVVDALGGTSVESHRAALDRASRAGAQLTTWNSVGCELQRDWARKETVPGWIQANIEQGEAWGWYLTLEKEVNELHHYTPKAPGKAEKVPTAGREAQA